MEAYNKNNLQTLWVLPTNKPSRLHLWTDENGSKLGLCDLEYSHTRNTQHIYIISDGKIKANNYCLNLETGVVFKMHKHGLPTSNRNRKIILTTDEELIENGVQAIPNEFLEWFVNNQSCESIDVEDYPIVEKYNSKGEYVHRSYWSYKIITPKEEQKKETILENFLEENYDLNVQFHKAMRESIFSFAVAIYDEKLPLKEWEKKHYGNYIEQPKQEILEEKLDRIIPKEPSKFLVESDERFKNKETLEEAVKRYRYNPKETLFIAGAKWQQEISYSEKEVKEIIKLSCEEGMLIQRTINDEVKIPYTRIKDFTIKMFEQFKKK